MNTLKVVNPVERQFAMIPNAVWSLPVSLTAKAILAFLLSHRDGTPLRVASIETQLNVGRDKRRKAMAELSDIGILTTVTERNPSGRITTRELVVDVRPLLDLPPENQSPSDLPPEKPAVGKSVATGAIFRASRAENQAPLYKTKIKTVRRADLTAHQIHCIRNNESIPINGELVAASSAAMRELRKLLEDE